jgi:hypothetical protein
MHKSGLHKEEEMANLITGNRSKARQDVRGAKGFKVTSVGSAPEGEVRHAAAVLEESVQEISGTAPLSQEPLVTHTSATEAEVVHNASVLEASAREAAGMGEPGHLITSASTPSDVEVSHATDVLQEVAEEVIGSANARDFGAGSVQPGTAQPFASFSAFGALGFNQGLDTLLQAVTAFSRAAEEARTEFAAAAKRRTDHNFEMINRLAGCRSLTEMAAAQRDVAREHLELTISELQQLTARSIQFSASALQFARPQPVSAR